MKKTGPEKSRDTVPLKGPQMPKERGDLAALLHCKQEEETFACCFAKTDVV
jgi:hypothetical protein